MTDALCLQPFDWDIDADTSIAQFKDVLITVTRERSMEYFVQLRYESSRGKVVFRTGPVPRQMIRDWARTLLKVTGGEDGF